jgi:hypothetical protein
MSDIIKIVPYVPLTPEQTMEAVRQGVYDAFWQMIRSGTDVPGADLFFAVERAVEKAVGEAMPPAKALRGAPLREHGMRPKQALNRTRP